MKKVIQCVVMLSLVTCFGILYLNPFNSQTGVEQQDSTVPKLSESDKVQVAKDYGKLPLHFEPNVGQTGDQVDFVSRGQGYSLFLTNGEAVLALNRPSDQDTTINQSDVVRIKLKNANISARVEGVEPLSGKSNYLLGNDPEKWRTDVPHFGKVKYDDVYPGIDLVYYGTEQRLLEHDFIVTPNVDPTVIRFTVEGAKDVSLDDEGNLIASTNGGDVVLQAPVTYQEIDGNRIPVESRYAFADNSIGFELAAYDANHTVVIDPVLSYSTYLGGSSQDESKAIVVDGLGNAYVVGSTQSIDYPLQSAFDGMHNGSYDVFVSVLNSSGSGLLYSTYLGGSDSDSGNGIAVDGSGNAYVTGYTQSIDYPLQSAFDGTSNGGSDVFVSVLNSSGSGLLYSTYLGGSDSESGNGITVDGLGNAYVTGYTQSTDYPLQSAFDETFNGGSYDVFVSVLNSSGSGLLYSTYLGGSNNEFGRGIAVDGSGNAYVAGSTLSTDYPLQSAFDGMYNGSNDVFVSVLNSSGSGLLYSTYLGGSNHEYGNGITVDGLGNAYVTGYTQSTDYPLQSAFNGMHNGGSFDVFVSVLNSSGSGLLYSTYLGGSGSDYGNSIAIDGSGNAYVTGFTRSTDYPLQSAFDETFNGSNDVFVSVLNSSGSGLLYSTYLGGSDSESGNGIAVDGSGNVYVVGSTRSTDYPLQSAFNGMHNGSFDAFVTKMSSPVVLLGVSIPNTTSKYNTTVDVPIKIETDVTGKGIVASEISVTYRNDIVLSALTNFSTTAGTVTTNSMVYQGWSVEENVFSGTSVDTLTIAMSTAQDTLTGSGDLIYLTLQLADKRQPDSTALAFVNVLFNDGTPAATSVDGSLKITGTDAAIATSPNSIRPGDLVSITLTDVDYDLDVGSADQVSVTAFSVTYGDSQSVLLTETGVNTGEFTGSVATEFSSVAGTPQDGVIGTIAGDSIGVVAIDVLTSTGTTAPLYALPVPVYGGEDGIVQTSYVVQAFDGRDGVRDTVRVQVTDADLDLDVGTAESVSAMITNVISGESESVLLMETDVNTGVFQARVPTIAGASGANNDGVLSLASWDTLTVDYVDSLSSQGGLSTVSEITRAVNLFGDVASNDEVQAFDAARLLAISVGLVSSNTQTTLVGDVDGSGDILAFDASLVLQYVVRLIDRFPVQTDTDITLPDDPKNHPFLKPALGDVIALGEMMKQTDGTYLVPVQLAEREGVLSATLTFGMDAGVKVLDVTASDDYRGFLTAHNETNGSVRVAFAGSKSELTGSGDMLLLRVRSEGDTPIRLSLDQVTLNGQSLTPSVNIEALEQVETSVPEFVTELHQNLPNPFNPQTTIRYGLAESGQVNVVIYSVTGQRVRTLVNAFQDAGAYQVVWDGRDALGNQVSSGVYLMRMQTNGFTETRKMMLLR